MIWKANPRRGCRPGDVEAPKQRACSSQAASQLAITQHHVQQPYRRTKSLGPTQRSEDNGNAVSSKVVRRGSERCRQRRAPIEKAVKSMSHGERQQQSSSNATQAQQQRGLEQRSPYHRYSREGPGADDGPGPGGRSERGHSQEAD